MYRNGKDIVCGRYASEFEAAKCAREKATEKQRTDALGRGKINPLLEEGGFDHDEKEEEKSEMLTWTNVSEVQLSSSGKIIPVSPSREIEGGTGNSEEDKSKCIYALERMRKILEPIYGETENKAFNRDSDILVTLGNAHNLEDLPTEKHVGNPYPYPYP